MATITLAELGRRLEAGATALPGAVPKYLQAAALLCVGELKRDMTEAKSPDGTPYKPLAHPRPNGGSIPLNDEGLLKASLGGGPHHVERLSGAALVLGTNQAGANVHQHGATIVPTGGRKYLAIPLTSAAKKAGSPKAYPGDLVGRYGKVGGVLLDAAGVAQYALAKKVTVPARPFVGFSVALKGKLRQLALAVFGTGLTKG